jgi:1,4-alpha-glucan branching enzyme
VDERRSQQRASDRRRAGPLCAIAVALMAACGGVAVPPDADGGGPDGGDPGPTSDAGLLDAGSFDGGVVGASLYDGGARFRVWAPNAESVTVSGDFGRQPLAAQGGGYFAGAVAGAQAMQRYRYLIDGGGEELTRTDPAANLIGADPGGQEPAGLLYDPAGYAWSDAGFVMPSPRETVIYELHIGTFVDDGGAGTGTYASAATRLRDLAQLGVNVIELMPVAEFPGAYSWGYNPTYPLAPSRAYGTPAELQGLIDQAHQLGIGVLLDVVFNHFGLDSRSTPSLSMWCFDGPCGGGGIYFSPEPATIFGPRPAFGAPAVHDLILQSIASWQSSYRADGFRWDSVVAIRNLSLDGTGAPILEGARMLRDANLALHARDPNAFSIAEDLQGWSAITTPIDPRALDSYTAGYGFDAQWDDSFFYALRPLLTASADAARDVTALTGPLTSLGALKSVIYSEDHDKVSPQNGAGNQRIPALIGLAGNGYFARRRSGLGLAMVLTAPGIPMLFMGQEFLETLLFPFSRGQAIDWSHEQTNAGFRQMIHDLIALRKNTAGTTRGLTSASIQILEAKNSHNNKVSPALAFHRWDQGGKGDDTEVVANFSNTQLSLQVGFPRSGVWHVRFNSDQSIYSPDFGNTPSADVTAGGAGLDGMPQSGTVQLGPYSVVILSQ